MTGWAPQGSSIISHADLKNRLSLRFVKFVVEHCADFAQIVECRTFEQQEIVSFDLKVDLPQYPAYDIRETEPLSICFSDDATIPPAIFVNRADFPDTPHQNLVPEGFPFYICIDDRPWHEVRSGFDVSELMQRILDWFSRACLGELHDLTQPIDPVFAGRSFHEIILTSAAVEAIETKTEKLVVQSYRKDLKYLAVSTVNKVGDASVKPNLVIGHISIEPSVMTRMRKSPKDLSQLDDFLSTKGANLLAELIQLVGDWQTNTQGHIAADGSLFCLLVSMPLVHPKSNQVVGRNIVAFISNKNIGQIGEVLGLLYQNTTGVGKGFQYLKKIGAVGSMNRASEIDIGMALVHNEFNAALATKLSGVTTRDDQQIVLIGAGSLGSSISESLVREGLSNWTIVDDDDLLPHNLGRHTLTQVELCHPKATGLADRLNCIRDDANARPLVANALSRLNNDLVAERFESANLIIDASASVEVSRAVSDWNVAGRRISTFFTPTGKSAILMVEDAARSVTVRDLEACYLREVLVNPLLDGHFGAVEEMRYTGACRAITNRIPSTSVHLLTGLIAHGISKQIKNDDPHLQIWTLNDDGNVGCINVSAEVFQVVIEKWTITIPESLKAFLFAEREGKLPNETGGVLLGVLDLDNHRIDVVHALSQPEDSVGRPTDFTRGVRKLRKAVDRAVERSGDQVRYIGEWHSHPTGALTHPSRTDIKQLSDLTFIMDIEGAPAVSIIVGESGIRILIGQKADLTWKM